MNMGEIIGSLVRGSKEDPCFRERASALVFLEPGRKLP